ncbi:MAG: HipA N-terminal domain-containing protein [Propionibacteriaceae bacterium]|nr:HipA N-terminal domain-containing protein [Propionibacteriaceae bacterium]
MIDVQQATVYQEELPATELSRGPEGVTFHYRDGYLGPAVAHTLPAGGEPVRTPPDALPRFFAGLLPEGRRLDALRRWVKTSADDEFSLLLAVGATR